MIFDTLHLYNINHIDTHLLALDIYLDLIGKNDGVVFYSKDLSQSQFNKLINRISTDRIYFIVDNNVHNLKTISYDEWLELVNQYQKTFTWK